MTIDIVLVLAITLAAIYLFATEKLRMDAVAVLLLVSLTAFGLIDVGQALSGFSSPAVITVAAMFVLAAGLRNSGALSGIGWLLAKARSPGLFLLTLFGVLAVVAPFVNNTAIVAVFMPIVITATASIGMPASKALIPLSYVSQMAGVCTLVGTSTNLLINDMARDLGHEGFGMFTFAPLGIICFIVGCLYLLTIGRWLLPDSRAAITDVQQEIGKYITELRVMADSSLVGQSVEQAKLGEDYGVFVIEVLRDGQKLSSPRSQELAESDLLLVRGEWSRLDALRHSLDLEIEPELRLQARQSATVKKVLTEVLVAPSSRFEGASIATVDHHGYHESVVLAIHRRGQVLREKLKDVVFRVGDILLMMVPESELGTLRKDRNLVVLSTREARKASGWRAPFALVTMVLVIAVAALGWASIAVTSLVGAVAMTLTGCLGADDAYESIDWRIIILLAGLLPLGIAMSQTGAAEFLVRNTLGLVQSFGPWVVLAVLYLMALTLTEFMSHAAAAVLLTPIGMSTANLMDVSPTPFLIAVTFAAATSFATPVGYQTNTMVYGAGGYRFTDFIKVGLPLNVIFWLIGIIAIPIFWPF